MTEDGAASQTDLKAARVPIGWRDQCSALLIPLNLCRRAEFYLPWKCTVKRHAYEKCQYADYIRRMKKLSKQISIAAQEE